MLQVKIIVNGEDVKLTDFPKKIITNILIGILSSLHGVDDIQSAVIELKELVDQ